MSPHLHTPNLSLTLAFTLSALLLAQPVSGPPPPPPAYPTSITTWYVDCTAPAAGDGLSWSTAFRSIQTAINAAHDGQTVIVATGTYPENLHFNGHDIVLRSTNPRDPQVVSHTIIDGQELDSVITFAGGESPRCILEGFTITNGLAQRGGGLRSASSVNPTHAIIRRNLINDNYADYGGAIAFCSGPIRDNTIFDNLAYGHGGALYQCLNAQVTGNVIAENHARCDGGGLYECTGSNVDGNIITRNFAAEAGGGLAKCSLASRNLIVANQANYGAGIDVESTMTLCSNLIAYNTAELRGGGLAIFCWPPSPPHWAHIFNNTFVANSAMYHGGAIDTWTCPETTVINCIFRHNAAREEPDFATDIFPTYSCIEHYDGRGQGNIFTDPLFAGPLRCYLEATQFPSYDPSICQTTLTVEPAGLENNELRGLILRRSQSRPSTFIIAANTHTTVNVWGDATFDRHIVEFYPVSDYSLCPDSPCIDAGYNHDSVWTGPDVLGNLRVVRGASSRTVDMGSYEYGSYAFHIALLEKSGDDAIELTWTSRAGDTYKVQSRPDLDTGQWTDMAELTADASLTSWVHTSGQATRIFYRVQPQ